MNSQKVTIELTNSEALVLFDFLAKFNEHDELEFEHPAERRVLWDVESILEKSLVEFLKADYDFLVKEAKTQLEEAEN